ncbi:exosortase-associated EpsI family protein [Singulisphaera sp. Ch08]|uniref:Exosortase-associated EpsI family protein n=1 Tax=Singulisphaera sp. Ch08 TaxID=3120278 RepID=A0AAU7CCG9_9BACT
MLRLLPTTLALALVISAGIVHGRWTQRWAVSHTIEDAAARLRRLPMTLGDWQGMPMELDRKQVELAEIAGYVVRRYEDRVNKDVVTILLVCGSPGPISVHTPDICYAGAGFELIGAPELFTGPTHPSGPPALFRNALFGKTNATVPTYLRILWSWSASGPWVVPENPRLAFASSQVLYKLYLVRQPTSTDERIEDDPSPRFLGLLLPELEQILFGRTGRGSPS